MLEFLTVDYIWEPCLAIFGLFSSGISAAASMANTQAQIASNERMQRDAQKYNTSERVATQRYGTSEREAAQAYNTSEREAQNQWSINAYNDYQSPAAMARQYAEAGLNPGLAAGNSGSLGTASGSSAQSSGATSSFQGVTPPYQNVEGFASGFQNIAQALKAIGDAKKAGVETKRMEQFMAEELKKLKLGNDAQELANSMNAVKYRYLDDKERAEVNKILQEISNGQLQGEELRKQIELLAKKNLIEQNVVDTWYQRFNVEQSNIEADTNLKGAQAREASASANANNALAAFTRTKNVTQQFVNSMNEKFGAEIRACERDLLQQQKAYNQDTYIQRVNMVSSTLEKMSWEIEKLRAEGRWAEINQILHAAGSLANTAMNVGIGFSAFKGKAKGILEDAAEAGFYNDNGPVDPPQPFN